MAFQWLGQALCCRLCSYLQLARRSVKILSSLHVSAMIDASLSGLLHGSLWIGSFRHCVVTHPVVQTSQDSGMFWKELRGWIADGRPSWDYQNLLFFQLCGMHSRWHSALSALIVRQRKVASHLWDKMMGLFSRLHVRPSTPAPGVSSLP